MTMTGQVPEVRVSAGRGGVHLLIPTTPPAPVYDEIRAVWECQGHAECTFIRGGADIAYSRKNGKPWSGASQC